MVQKAPEYEWRCPRCHIGNSPGSEICHVCRCPANFTIREIRTEKTVDSDLRINKDGADLGRTLWIFLPEAIPAFLVAVITPFRAIDLLIEGQVLKGTILIVAEVVGLFGFLRAIQAKEKWLAYAFMIALMIVAGMVSSIGP